MYKKVISTDVILSIMTSVFSFVSLTKGNSTVSLNVGRGEGSIAYSENIPEVETLGPKSFAVRENGSLYVLDTIDGHIEVFDKKGKYQDTVEISENAEDYFDILTLKDEVYL